MEQTGVLKEGAGLKPDIVIHHPGGLPVVVETEYAPARTVETDARDRLGKTLRSDGHRIEQSIALRIPDSLATGSQHKLRQSISEAALEFAVFSGNPQDPDRWPEAGWIEGGVDDLASCIELAAMSEDRIARGLGILEAGISQAALILRDGCADAPVPLDRIAKGLHQQDGAQTTRMAMAIVANALTFHTAIAGSSSEDGSFVIDTLDELRGETGALVKRRVLQHWRDILDRINYWPIFRIASDILAPIPNGVAQRVLDRLSDLSSELVALGATSQHDLSGRMFQRLIADRKFLATFYTLPSSAALLAELAIARLGIDWSDPGELRSLRIADFACGTGALLNAAYQAALSRYRRQGGDDRKLHAAMMESALVGADIMPAAAHLTASVLSSAHPTVPFTNTSIVTLPYGQPPKGSGRSLALGALDLIGEETTLPLFGTGRERLRGRASDDDGRMDLPHGGFDLVIMNPPFTRPTGQEAQKVGIPVPSFAGFDKSEDEQKAMSRKLARIRKPGMAGHGNAGLASNFIDIADAKLKRSGGVLALVLPASFLQGDSWAGARRMLEEHYSDIAIVSIAATGSTDRAFSADTGMAEVLIVATRRDDHKSGQEAAFLNLNRRPETILEAVTLGKAAQNLPNNIFSAPLRLGGGGNAGSCIRGSLSDAGCAGIKEAGVAQAAAALLRGELLLPRRSEPVMAPLVNLGILGSRGLYHMDISGTETIRSGLPRGPFDIVQTDPGVISTWPALWGHDAKREARMIVKPDRRGLVRPECDDRAAEAWCNTASRLHFNRDFQINSQPLAACMTPEPSIGGRAWPNFLCADQRWEVPLALWANTTLGLIAFWWIGTRQQQGRATLTISRLPA